MSEVLLYQQSKKDYKQIVCSICKVARCGRHCNNQRCLAEIGRDIEWKQIDGSWRLCIIGTESKHECMKKGTVGTYLKDGKELIKDCKWCHKPITQIHDCYYDQVVILESDNSIVKQIKMKRQYKLKHRDDFVYRPADPKWLSFSFGMKG